MPLLVPVFDLQPGMRLSEAFVWKGRTMLPGGKRLTTDDVEVLRCRYPHVSLRVGDPLLDALVEFEDDSRDREIATTVQSRIAEGMNSMQHKLCGQTSMQGIDFDAARASAISVISYLKCNPATAALLNRTLETGSYLADHCGSVFYLAMVLGSAVRDYVARERVRQTSASRLSPEVAMNMLPLGLGVMFMDLGMYPLKHLYDRNYRLTDDDRQSIREHPIVGSDLIPDSMPAGVKMIVRTHHENLDGSGYPFGMSGASLHVFTRIVRICDAFDAATSKRVHAAAKSPVRVLWEMCAGPWKRYYDPVLTKVFLSLIQPFPIGAKLKLADGRGAVVVRYNRKHAFHPWCVVAFDESDQRLPKEALVGPIAIGEDNDLLAVAYP